MSDHRPDPDSDLTPAQDDAVRALLASARHTGATPPQVVARLDDTLASLNADRVEVRAPVVTLASRRRRTAATVLLAAAAVVVFGVGIGQVLPTGTSSDDSAGGGSAESATSAQDQESTADSDSTFEDEGGDEGEADGKLGEAQQRATEAVPAPTGGAATDLQSLTSDADLKPQLRALRRATAPSAFSADPLCALPDAGSGKIVSVTYDGQPAALIFRDPVDNTQQVDVYFCGEPGVQRSLQLRAP